MHNDAPTAASQHKQQTCKQLGLNIELKKAEGRNATSTLVLLFIQHIAHHPQASTHFYSKPHLDGSQWGPHVQRCISLGASLQEINVSYWRYGKNAFMQLHFWT